MRRAKLEMYIDLLKVLAYRGPLKITDLMYRANINHSLLKHYLEFLTRQNLVREIGTSKNRKVYEITPRGMQALEFFKELKTEYVPPTLIRKSKYVDNESEIK